MAKKNNTNEDFNKILALQKALNGIGVRTELHENITTTDRFYRPKEYTILDAFIEGILYQFYFDPKTSAFVGFDAD